MEENKAQGKFSADNDEECSNMLNDYEEYKTEHKDSKPFVRLSKQAKKLLRYESKREMRRQQKRKNDQKKKQKRAEFLTSLSETERNAFIAEEKSKKAANQLALQTSIQNGIPLLIDVSYSSLMNTMEQSSLITQLTQIVGFLKKSDKIFFHISCINASDEFKSTLVDRGCGKWMINVLNNDIEEVAQGKQVIMLSPDSTVVLEEVDSQCVYVIGGLVDRTRKKAVSLKKAQDKQLLACRLPIEEEDIMVSGK